MADFDENGVMYFLATMGRKASWKNPMGLSQVEVIKSEVGFGRSEDFVGRTVVNLRTGNNNGSFFGIDLLKDRLFVVEGYCLRGRNATSHALLNWKLQGRRVDDSGGFSSGAGEWVDIDEQTGVTVFRQTAGATAYFTCNLPLNTANDENGLPKNSFRQFRVLQVGKNSSGTFNLGLSGIEIYGNAVRGTFPY
jgi:hypothetical protein